MNFRFAVLFTVSCAAHAALLGWTRDRIPPLRLGGEARPLQVSVVPPVRQADTNAAESVRQPRPAAPPEHLAVRTPLTRKRPPDTSSVRHPPAGSPAKETATPSTRAAAATVPQPSPAHAPQPAPDSVSDRISAALLNRLAERFEYPWIARKRGWQGLVTLSLRVEQNGELTNWAVSQTSGHSVLDRSALSAAKRIRRLPEAAEWLNGAPVDMLLPVQYRLLGS
jgi:protein TonB